MGDDVRVLQCARVAVNEELFWRHALDTQLALFFLAANLDAVGRCLNFHARLVNIHRILDRMLDHSHVVGVQKVCVFIVGQVGKRENLCGWVRHPVRFGDALLFDQRVMEHVAQHAVPVQAFKLVVHKGCGLLCGSHVFRSLWRKLNRLGCAKEYAHQRGLHGTYSIPYLCGHNLAASALVADIHLAVVIALSLNAVLAYFALNKVNGRANGSLHNALDLRASFWL